MENVKQRVALNGKKYLNKTIFIVLYKFIYKT